MNPTTLRRRCRAFTLVELLVVIAILAILAALLMPVFNKSQMRAKRIWCENSQRQIGLAFHVFSNDHAGKFSMEASTNDGGSLEFVESGFSGGETFYTAYKHFQALANELVQPQILVCPTDIKRTIASNFPALQNENVSYFVGVNSTFDKPESILAGDRNLATNSYQDPTILQIGPVSRLQWTWEMHQSKGNVVFADGHVEEWNDASLNTAASQSSTNQSFFLPSVIEALNSSPGGYGGAGSSPPYTSSPSSPSQSAPSFSTSNTGQPMSAIPSQGSPSNQMPHYSSASGNISNEMSSTEAAPTASASTTEASPDHSGDVAAATPSEDAAPGMSSFDTHLMKTMQHTFEWLYLLLLLLMLMYLAYKIRQWLRKREAKRKRASQG
jgi:prepilin-type N-terminal cleavage/methylation domain-containing protein/prepilin-type processing-associated H-X9-DG protein